jgi:glucan phosphoethanolaminetransferase (alkaline phosphatase superfamily)
MKLKPQELIGSILFSLGAICTLHQTFYSVKYSFQMLRDVITQDLSFSMLIHDLMYWFLADLSYSFVALLAFFAMILVLIRKANFAIVFAFLSSFLIIFSALMGAFAWSKNDPNITIFSGFNRILFSSGSNSFLQGISHFPPLLFFAIGAVLLLLSKSEQAAPEVLAPQSVSTPQQFVTSATPSFIGGMKKCPDCAELIQAEAVKCRFCNYRYE